MKNLLKFTTETGEEFFIEVSEPSVNQPVRGAVIEESSRGIIQDAAGSFEKALKPLKEISNSIVNSIREIVQSPDEIGVELGLKFSTKAGIIITSLDSEANFKITLKWNKAGSGR